MCQRAKEIETKPFKILEAPGLIDDFYTSALDWNSSNVVALALPKTVFLWNATTTCTTQMTDPAPPASKDPKSLKRAAFCSVTWRPYHSETLTVGKRGGMVQLLDVVNLDAPGAQINIHTRRVGALAWSPGGELLASGSKDQYLCLYDPRKETQVVQLTAHQQEICGIKWEPIDGNLFASGGNDNLLIVWDKRKVSSPLFTFTNHKAAVKALAWSPHRKGILVSGGGTADRHMKYWDAGVGALLDDIDTGSQVCTLHWSANIDELVSTHGYSQNHIVVWDGVSHTAITSLRGHTARVLHMAPSPDGRTIVTGAGDATLRFWHLFPSKRSDSLGNQKIPGFSLDLR